MYSSRTTKEAVNDAKSSASQLADNAKDTVVTIKEDLTEIANRAGRNLRARIDAASEEVSNARDTVAEQIKAKPIQSGLIALGAGFLLGALFRR